jgi:hypothetical protein
MPSFLRAVLATCVYALLHSLLASRECKELAARAFGERARNAFYRPFFILQALASFAALAVYLARLPSRVLYRVRGPWAWVMNACRLGALILGAWAAREVGLPGLTGWSGFRAWRNGDADIPPGPEAQGPAPEGPDMRARGPFRFSRHPLNLVPVPFFALSPKMTDRSMAFTLAAAAYLWLGSKHEERRLGMAYGEAYRRYRDSGIPFYFGLRGMPKAERDA